MIDPRRGFQAGKLRSMSEALQDRYAAKSMCFGCGPANDKGLRIKSRVEGEELVATFAPEPHHIAFPGVVNGGIIGALLDCHCNWAASWQLMVQRSAEAPPCTVTASYTIDLKRPTPVVPLELRARVVETSGDRAVVEGTLTANGKVTATCRGTFIAVKEGHPAFHRW